MPTDDLLLHTAQQTALAWLKTLDIELQELGQQLACCDLARASRDLRRLGRIVTSVARQLDIATDEEPQPDRVTRELITRSTHLRDTTRVAWSNLADHAASRQVILRELSRAPTAPIAHLDLREIADLLHDFDHQCAKLERSLLPADTFASTSASTSASVPRPRRHRRLESSPIM